MRQQVRNLVIAGGIALSLAATAAAAQPAADSAAAAVAGGTVGHAAAPEIGSASLAMAWFAGLAIFAFAVGKAMRVPAR